MKDLENIYTYHAPKQEQQVKYQEIRKMAKNFAQRIEELCPSSREKSLAHTRLEEVVMWANAAIARNE